MTLKMTRREVLLVINSKDAQTADNGSSATNYFQPALEMGDNAKVELIAANIWYAMPNIAAPNNTLSYEYTKEQMVNGALVTTQSNIDTITFDPGLYGLSSLNNTIARELSNHLELSRYDISLSGDESTGRVALHLKTTIREHVLTNGEFNITELRVKLPESTILTHYLGYNGTTDLVTPAGVSEYEFIGSLPANLNTLKSILVNCSQCSGSVLNGRNSGILANIPISVSVGSQIQYQPLHAAKISAPQMSSGGINEMTLSLHDQDMKALNMGGEYWEAVLIVSSD